MTVGSLVVYQIAEPEDGAAVASTMVLTTLLLFHLAGGLLARDRVNTIFDRLAIPGTIQLRRYGIALLAIVYSIRPKARWRGAELHRLVPRRRWQPRKEEDRHAGAAQELRRRSNRWRDVNAS